MKTKTYDALVNLINTSCIYILILSLFFTLQGRSYDISRTIILQTLGVCSVTFLYFFLRKYVNNLAIFILMHITPTVLYILFFTAPTERYLYFAVFIVVFPLISMAMKYNAKPQKLTAMGFAPILMILLFYLFVAENNTKLQSILSFLTFVFVILVIINSYLVNTYNFITSNDTAIGETLSIRKASSKFFKILLVLTCVFCLLFSNLSSNFVFKYFRAFLHKIMSLIARFFVTETKEEFIMPSVPPVDAFDAQEGVTATMPPKEDLPLNLDVPIWLIYLVAILFGIFVIVLTVYLVVKHFKKTSVNLEDVHEFVSPFEKTTKIKEAKKKKKVNEGFGLFASYDKRIRKIFKKTIDKNMNPFIKINKTHTPTQLCDSTECGFEKSSEYADLRGIYYKARYSNKDITKSDYNEAKQLGEVITSESK